MTNAFIGTLATLGIMCVVLLIVGILAKAWELMGYD